MIPRAMLSPSPAPSPVTGVRAVSPRPFIAFADGAVFAATPGAPAGSPYAAVKAADLHLSWMEHEAYAVRVIIPKRFGLLDAGGPPTPGNPAIADRVAAALARFRPAGVDLRVELADGQGAVGGAATLDPITLLQGGTVLAPSPHPPT